MEEEARKDTEEAPTSTKRELKVYPAEMSMFKISYEGGGETPDDLKGTYTSASVAQRAIIRYLVKA